MIKGKFNYFNSVIITINSLKSIHVILMKVSDYLYFIDKYTKDHRE